jgi:beta-aspartyl-peptidase (threonine type)
LVVLLAGGAVAAVAWATALRQEPATDHEAIRRVLDDQDAAWNRGDLEGFMAGYRNSPDMTFYSGNAKQQGWQEAFDRYRKRYQAEGKEMGKLTFSELQIDLLGPGVALVRGRWKLVLKEETPEGLFTLIVRRFPEGWRIVHDHTSAKEKS